MIQNVDFMGDFYLKLSQDLTSFVSQWLLSILFPFASLRSLLAGHQIRPRPRGAGWLRKITGQKMEEKYGTLLGCRADL